jgi:carbamoyl-phosphate synthase large subunit
VSPGASSYSCTGLTTVIFTCAGQRAEIVRAFSRAGATTIAADSSPLAPALYHADAAVEVPRCHEPGYIEALRAIVREHEADLILPLTDLDPALLAHERARLGALVLLPKPEIVDRAADKLAAHEFLLSAGIGSPRTWHPNAIPRRPPFPVFLKLRYGSATKQVATAHRAQELAVLLARMEGETIVQELCAGDEFSLDVFCDLDGRCLNSIPRTMIESKGGESIKGATIGDGELIAFGQRVAEAFGVVGPATVQCFREADGRLLVTDINLRFGGAFPLPTAAGSLYPEYALALARGEPLEARVGKFERDVVLSCYPTHVTLKHGPEGMRLLADAAAVDLRAPRVTHRLQERRTAVAVRSSPPPSTSALRR